jgi:multidrug efflux pump subunit AcrA (membrane-fusion protein)
MSIKLLGFALTIFISQTLLAANAPSTIKEKVVFTLKASATEIADQFSYPAEILPEITSDTLADFKGEVVAIKALVGQEVKKGEEVLRLRHLDPLFQNKTLSYRAPFAGIISEVPVSLGTQVGQGEKLFNLIDPVKKKIQIQLTENDMRSLKVGDLAELEFIGIEEKISVQVIGISPKLDLTTGTALTLLKPVKELKLPAGNLAKVHFKTNLRKGILVPDHALSYVGRDLFLRTVVEGKVVFKPIKIGKKKGVMVEVLEGISDGEIIIERTNSYLDKGDSVVVKDKG